MCRDSEASKARGNLFSLLGLATDSKGPCIEPSYGKPFEEVLMNYDVYLLESSEPDNFLSLAQPKLQDPRFPSWAPDWTVKNKRSNMAEAFVPQEKKIVRNGNFIAVHDAA